MSAQSLLDQLLKSGLGGLGGVPGATMPKGGADGDLSKYLTGGAVGGALGMLLGSRKGRSLGGKALKLGSVAALGALAYRAYQEWQASQAATAPAASVPAAPAPIGFARLPAPAQEQHSQAMLKAMIAAARSDGHMDERERQLVEGELHRLEADPTLRRWVDDELRRPIDPADVAASVQGPEAAAEVYLASLVVVDETTVMERAYLDELARQLKLPEALKADLEARVK